MQAHSSHKAQRAVLALVVFEHPSPLGAEFLAREIGAEAAEAVADLTAVGLLRCDGDAVHATEAAIRFEALA